MIIIVIICLIAALVGVGMVIERHNKSVKEGNLSTYNSIEEGMTYKQVVDLLGSEGIMVTEDYDKDERVYVWYFGWYTRSKGTDPIKFTGFNNIDWDNIDKTNPSNVNSEKRYIRIVFQKDKLVSKGQKGLEIQ